MFFSGLLVKKLARSLLCNFRTIGAEQPNRDGRQPMAGFNAFHISTLGMMAQSDNLGVIGQNIANATTTGYKRQEARFSTVLSHSVAVGNEFRRTRDTGGVRSHAINTIDGQGILHQTDRTNDLGIAGDGFFILNSLVDGDGETYYGRDGSFILAAGDRLAVAAPGPNNDN